MNLLFNFYQLYLYTKKYQPQIEQSFYAISSSKVQKEEVIKIPMQDGIKLNALFIWDVVNTEKIRQPLFHCLSKWF